MSSISERKSRKTITYALEHIYISQHGNLHQLSKTMGRVTYFILRANTGIVLAKANTGKAQERFSKKIACKWTGRVETRKEKSIAVGVACTATYGPAPVLKRRTLSSGFSSTDGILISASVVPYSKREGKDEVEGYSSRLHDVDILRIVYSEAYCAVGKAVHERFRAAQEVAVTQLAVVEIRHGVTTIVEQHEGHYPFRVLKSEINNYYNDITNKATMTILVQQQQYS